MTAERTDRELLERRHQGRLAKMLADAIEFTDPCLPEGFTVNRFGFGKCPACGGWHVSEVDAREFDRSSGEAIDDTDLFIQCLRCKTTWPGPVELRMAIAAAAMAEGGEHE